ncbi:flagellar protein FliS [Syntrophobotulus glycolicus DSM 8271]|uniref:Flagellar secretion chaperone FliS n=1 Tax=Syntrophobotulus glycolicus (strain DSM 8271 / FlGlyR) TaxID=645991 RepID=F0SU38_SYNGF|nr:flagellar export chaperone FliS [Syntrophobotulus glycolicus]ADY55421.1 flagellar protein FliS [Syntrophobotulus glycolicus DSM 8271]
MSMLQKQYRQNYLQAAVFTASPEKLTLLLYTHLVQALRQAGQAMEKKDPEKTHHWILKAKKILLYLENTLDQKYEISASLSQLYTCMYRLLTGANVKKDREALEQVLHLAGELRDTWAQASELAGGGRPANDGK